MILALLLALAAATGGSSHARSAHPAPRSRTPAKASAPARPKPSAPPAATAATATATATAPAVAVAASALAPIALDASPLAQRIASRLQAAVKSPCLVTASVGLTVRDAQTGALIYEHDGSLPLKPASNMKLVTGSAAIDLLGPERTLKTAFRADHAPDASGAVGTLYVVGGGDPSLTIEALYLAARALAMRGVRKVSSVVVDDSFFAGPNRPPSWPDRNRSTWYGAPCSALGVNFNVVSVQARGRGRTGDPAATWVDPFPTFFDVQSSVRTGAGGIGARGELSVAPDGQVAQRMSVTGRVRNGQTVRILVPVEDPALYCGHGVVESLRRVGIEVAGGVTRGTAPAGSSLLHEQPSRPMAELVRDMNKPSSNVFAETLLKLLGAEMYGAPGTREKGVEVLRAWLEQASPGGCTCHLADGSGLSPDDRVTSRLLTDLLLSETTESASFPEYLASLPVSGADGTLRRRFRQTHAKRLVRAKTGRIAQVAALSGFAEIGERRRAVFSLLVNDYHCPTWKTEGAVDAVVEALVADAPAAPDPRKRLNLPPLPEEAAPTEEAPGESGSASVETTDESGETTDEPPEEQPSADGSP